MAVWEATYQEDLSTKNIYEVAIRSSTTRHDLKDAKRAFDNGKFFHLSTMGERVLVPRTLVTAVVAMHHNSEFYSHSGVLCTMALSKRDYMCSHLRHYLPRYILSSHLGQAATSRHVSTAGEP